MPHKKNPAEGHNPFDVIKNARKGSTTTTTPKPGPPKSSVVTRKRNPGQTMISKRAVNRKRAKRRKLRKR